MDKVKDVLRSSLHYVLGDVKELYHTSMDEVVDGLITELAARGYIITSQDNLF